MSNLKPIHPDNLRWYWDEIRPMLLRVKAKVSERWLPEDVYAAIKNGSAHLYAVLDDYQGVQAIVIYKRERDWDGFVLRVWIACNKQPDRNTIDYLEQSHRIARSSGCKRIVWDSSRKGYVKIFPNTKISYRYELEVD